MEALLKSVEIVVVPDNYSCGLDREHHHPDFLLFRENATRGAGVSQ